MQTQSHHIQNEEHILPKASDAAGEHSKEQYTKTNRRQTQQTFDQDGDPPSSAASRNDSLPSDSDYTAIKYSKANQYQQARCSKKAMDKKILENADTLRSKAIKHCMKHEYFDVLTNTHKCSKIICQLSNLQYHSRQKNSSSSDKSSQTIEDNLRLLRGSSDATAFLILKDCIAYSAIAYVQLQ